MAVDHQFVPVVGQLWGLATDFAGFVALQDLARIWANPGFAGHLIPKRPAVVAVAVVVDDRRVGFGVPR